MSSARKRANQQKWTNKVRDLESTIALLKFERNSYKLMAELAAKKHDDLVDEVERLKGELNGQG